MLARSSRSAEAEVSNIVKSTSAVIFLGTPHRGSPDLASVGEWARSLVSNLRMGTTSTLLDALALNTTDLERAQEAFSGLWAEYDFRVKTFQEGLGLTGVNLGVLGNKVVPDYSSVIGDPREQSETLQANHMDMCRFDGASHPNYRKVAGEIRTMYLCIANLALKDVVGNINPITLPNTLRSHPDGTHVDGSAANGTEKASIQHLSFPTMNIRRLTIEGPAEQTCEWLFAHESYRRWFTGESRDESFGLLCIKGYPGAGKSILMKEAFRRAALGRQVHKHCVSGFFFSAKGRRLEHSPEGLFRSLLFQLLPQDRSLMAKFMDVMRDRDFMTGGVADLVSWHETKVRSAFRSVVTSPLDKRILIFVDALDECDATDIRWLAYFWREVTMSAHDAGVDLNVCLSTRHFPSVTLSNCVEIVLEQHNADDIRTYVDQKFKTGIACKEPKWELLRAMILEKSAGVFLWVVLVVDKMLQKWDEGQDLQSLLQLVNVLPDELSLLYDRNFADMEAEKRPLALRLFQWVVLAAKPLRVHEWHHVMAFIRTPAPSSLHNWRASDSFTKTDDQLEKQIRTLSMGLVEVAHTAYGSQDTGCETLSVCAGAGSLNLEYGESRVVQVIHESVRDYFLKGQSLQMPSTVGAGHLSIMATCLDYINIAEMDALIRARIEAANNGRSWLGDSTGRHSSPAKSLERDESRPPPTRLLVDNLEIAKLLSGEGKEISASKPQEQATTDSAVPEATVELGTNSEQRAAILRWVSTTQRPDDSLSAYGSTHNSIAAFSDTFQSQILEDYPALLSYVSFEFFTHAQLAEDKEENPKVIIDDRSPSRRRYLDSLGSAQRRPSLEHIPTGLRCSVWSSFLGQDPHSTTSCIVSIRSAHQCYRR